MNTAKKIYPADEDGVIHVDLPVGHPGREVELLLVWDELEAPSLSQGDVGDLVGLLGDMPIERPAQGEYEERDELT